MESFTVTFTGKSSELESVFFPPIDLTDGQYYIGLVDFQSYNSLFNIVPPNNVLHYYEPKILKLNGGLYPLTALNVETKGKAVFKITNGKLNVEPEHGVRLIPKKGLLLRMRNEADKFKKEPIVIQSDEEIWYYNLNEEKEIIIPSGSYELAELERVIKETVPDFTITGNNNTMKCTIKSSKVFDFVRKGMGTEVFGFSRITEPDVETVSTRTVNINSINVLRIKCNIADGSYINGHPTHSIHNFYPNVPPGYKIIEVVRNIIYFPINVNTLSVVTISIVDQNDNLVSFNGEEVTLRCHIKKTI